MSSDPMMHDFTDTKRTARPVWVENGFGPEHLKDQEQSLLAPYTEVFRGETISIPPKGRIKMKFLAAERFLSQPVRPAEQYPDGKFKVEQGFPKMLKIVEFTDQERKDIGMGSKKDMEAASLDDSKLKCTLCDYRAKTSHGLLIHVARMHPEMEIAEES